jgi:hypothetical protein
MQHSVAFSFLSKKMCVDFQSKLSGVTNMRQEFTVCQIKSHFSIVCRFSLFSLKKKVGEYEEIIVWMEHKYTESCQDYQTQIDCIEAYYTAFIAKNTPQYVMKH